MLLLVGGSLWRLGRGHGFGERAVSTQVGGRLDEAVVGGFVTVVQMSAVGRHVRRGRRRRRRHWRGRRCRLLLLLLLLLDLLGLLDLLLLDLRDLLLLLRGLRRLQRPRLIIGLQRISVLAALCLGGCGACSSTSVGWWW